MSSIEQLRIAAKLRAGRALSTCLRLARRVSGRDGDLVVCERGGVTWELDLREIIDLAIYLTGTFERSTSLTMGRLLAPGMVALDIGANVGCYALPMAARVGSHGRVYAIEPTDFAFGKLCRNRELNPSVHAALVPIKRVLGDPGGVAPTHLYSSWSLVETSAHPLHAGQLRAITNSELVTLDALVDQLGLTSLDFVKMDVDGHECRVLRGGRHTFTRFRPRMLLELYPYVLQEHGHTLGELLDLLREFDYTLYALDGQTRLPDQPVELERMIPRGGGINALACA